MFDFMLHIPTEIHFGENCEKKAGELMRPLAQKVLLVYGSERIFETGLAQQLLDSLKEAGCETWSLGGVKPNAETDWIERAIQFVRENRIEGILAVGGGSVIDSAKAVSAGSRWNGSILDLYENFEAQPDTCLPIGAVVTIPATASESNCMSVISDVESGRKIAKPIPQAQPKFALLNPQLTLTVSPYQTACGGFDMFAHAFERYFDLHRGSVLLDTMTEAVMRTVVETLPQVLADPQNLEKRSELMLAATIAHNDMLGPGGDFACHEISHVITEKTGAAHGAALAMIIPAWCRYMWTKNPERFAGFFRRVWGIEEKEDAEAIRRGIEKMECFIDSIGLARTIKLPEGTEIAEIAEGALGGHEWIGRGFQPLKAEDVEAICRMFLNSVA